MENHGDGTVQLSDISSDNNEISDICDSDGDVIFDTDASIDTCPICLEKFEDEDDNCYTPCSRIHRFHTTCINRALNARQKCPSCNNEITRSDVVPATFSNDELNMVPQCMICNVQANPYRGLSCGHIFHFRCISDVFENDPHCPVCREPVDAEARAEYPIVDLKFPYEIIRRKIARLTKTYISNDNTRFCAICKNNLGNRFVRRLRCCNCLFHAKCINPFLCVEDIKNLRCPVCRNYFFGDYMEFL